MSGGPTLSPDAIAALVDAAREGRLPEEASTERVRQRRMRTVDFTRPTKFTADQERRIRRVMDTFCRTASTRLSAELRMSLELEVINVSQLTWANAHGLVPPRSISAAVTTEDATVPMLLSAESGLVLSAIETLLGGSPSGRPTERRFTDIDWALARHFLDRMLSQLSLHWTDTTGAQLEIGPLDVHTETAQTAPVSEPTLAFTIEARMETESSTISLLMPHAAIEPVLPRFSQRDDAPSDDGAGANGAVRDALGRVEMTVRAEVASIELPIEDVLAIQAGDVVRLGARTSDGVTLFAGSVPMHRGQPGRSGSRRAVQVTGSTEGQG
jgi:flagellar motor switch protein FliM